MGWLGAIKLINRLLDAGKALWNYYKAWQEIQRKKRIDKANQEAKEKLNTKKMQKEVGKLLD